MKITDVEAIILRQPMVDDGIADGSQDDLIVLIHTDAGITGIGEVDSSPEVVKAAIEAPNSHSNSIGLRHVLIGQDPLQIGELWRRMYRASVYFGRRGVAIHAMSGIDLALWDIKGKLENKPVCELIGTKRRDRIKAYASTLMPSSEAEVTRRVDELGEMGFRAVKFGWGPLGSDVAQDIRLCTAAVRAAGSGMDILIDAGLGYRADPCPAITVAHALKDLGVFWLEEPFEADEFEAYAALASATSLRIAAGEHESTAWGFRELMERGKVTVVQPDVTRCGGLSEALKIAKLADERGVECVPHAWKSGVIKAASLHMNAVLPKALFQEYCVADTPINCSLTRQKLPLDGDGMVAVPIGPGLGVDLDPEIVERYRVG
jgi:L-rhamnonate dehydratase